MFSPFYWLTDFDAAFEEGVLVKNPKSIRTLFTLPGFVANSKLAGRFGDRYARIVRLRRRKKLQFARTVDAGVAHVTISDVFMPEICR